MHTFPSDPTLRKLWTRVARPSQPTCTPPYHFAEEDYVRSPAVLRSLGLPVKHVFLKPGVVPSLFTRNRKQVQLSGVEEKRRREEESKKRLVSAGKLKSLSALQDWVEPIVKHLYWCAESSDGTPEEILPKWTSLVAHVADVHEHADAVYPRCQHGDLGRKKWLSEAYVRELMEETLRLNRRYSSYKAAREANATDAPPPLSRNFERTDKNSLISKHRSRFNC
ncbi:hypothetical protein HPB47_017475 [Ixodes persulcatus]|uniref:Uncharacterized protein n=1 Tax=Ixodes persulcatus TaxID=34615 RepID=A0AC60QRR9_IXOPE|nr:hypothetical protein HPB47_017475 [Ixodes persulcatus]